jgi:hypothetical protein
MTRIRSHLVWSVALAMLAPGLAAAPAAIPLPEHPRPDFERAEWINLNGPWQFRFDPHNAGEQAGWHADNPVFPDTILVPFPWGSRLSGLADEADIGWYRRLITVPDSWKGQRVFIVVGACDWLTKGWIDGQPLGEHRGGYTPFEFELTPHVRWGQAQTLILRVDDTKHPFKLEGKQGYGPARGIWQTAYLEARPATHLDAIHFTPLIQPVSRARIDVQLSDPAPAHTRVRLHFKTGGVPDITFPVPEGQEKATAEVALRNPRLWTLEDPFLYEIEAGLEAGGATDRVGCYFGLRTISVEKLPGTEHAWIALNGKPLYLQIALDQSYHPDGFYTFPTDEFMRDEILRSKRIGLNANRFHVKIDVPRKLYWADRLGLLVMADLPNSWGEPDAEMRREIDYALRQMIRRDFNHPSIFSWVPFNETWGLFSQQGDRRVYLPETQEWVASIYRLTKSLDPTRLVEDNSPCNYDHVETDINSWHAYLPGYAWREHLEQVVRDTYPGSKWNFIGGRTQSGQPLLNSECGNVWGYEGSTGDVDWSWDYHIMMNEFRRQPKICGWLYTEHHDVINEWNGYYRFDRSEKFTGLEELVPGMSLRDLHAPFYISTGSDLCRNARPGETVKVPLFASFVTGQSPGRSLVLKTELRGWDSLGREASYARATRAVPFEPWLFRELDPLEVQLPDHRTLALLSLTLETEAGQVLHRNFTTFLVGPDPAPRTETFRAGRTELRVVRFAPATFRHAEWSLKQWTVLDGLKVNGAGHGHFEFGVPWPAGIEAGRVAGVTFLVEAGAKRLLGKDQEGAAKQEGDFMRGQGTFDPSLNPNAYPMTDTQTHPSAVRIRFNGHAAETVDLANDPADHRGILSWHAQPRDRKLREAGSYGYLVAVTVPEPALAVASQSGEIVIRLEVDPALPGGLALYGERFGRYPLDPTLVFHLK